MKILVVAPDQILLRAGGLRTQVERTMKEISLLGVEVSYFDEWKEYDFVSYDLIHIFSMNAPNFYKVEALRKKAPLVISSVMWRQGNRTLIKLFVSIIRRIPIQLINDVVASRIIGEWAKVILPNTDEERKWLKESLGLHNNYQVVPNGADNHFKGKNLEDLKRSSKHTYNKDFVFCASVISERKNLLKLAKACIKLGVPLVIAGPIVDINIYNALLKKKKNGAEIYILGELSKDSDELGYLYKACKVFCLPSYYETPGIAALEASLQGANLVITKIGGTREYFGNRACYIDPYSQKDIFKKLKYAWNRDWSEHFKNDLALHISKNYSWPEIAKKTKLVYEEVLSKR